MNNEIIAKKQFTSWTFKKLEQRTRIMALNSSFYHVFGISYKFKSEEDLHPTENGANLIYNASKEKIKEFINF